MAIAYESRAHRIADLVAGLIWTTVDRWYCKVCGRTAQHFTKNQKRQWDDEVPVECGRLMLGRRPCRGHLVRAEVAR
ncbi:MAG: hypothetical protein JWN52_6619 [Actinomycetia bacterium]|nr:hypothetical protein [Actinomycetes bacterium]